MACTTNSAKAAPCREFRRVHSTYHDMTRRLVAEAGYRCAVTTEPGTVIRGDDVLALRRCLPENVPAFLAAFYLLIRVWKDRRRPADGTQLVADRFSYLQPESVGDSA